MSESTELFSPLLERAARFAATAHDHGYRKGSPLPYIVHPFSAMLILQRAGFTDDEVLAAAVLHDVVEDTDVSLDSLRAEFPDDVVELVDAMTETKIDENGQKRPWRDRKDDHIAHMREATTRQRAVLLADKLHNLISMVHDYQTQPDFWSRFSTGRDKILWYYRTIVGVAGEDSDPRIGRLVAECLQKLEALISDNDE